MKHVPNTLTGLRFVLIVVFVYVFWIPKNYLAALIIFASAAVTDWLDGYLARKYDVVTDMGKLLDPLADKLMLLAALTCLSFTRRPGGDGMMLPMFFLVFTIIKEFAMIIGGIYLYRKKVVVYSRFVGKLATLFFNVGIVLTFLRPYFEPAFDFPINEALLYIAVALAMAAFVLYAVKSFMKPVKELRQQKRLMDGTED